jgi:uncharacterized Zn finger protein
MSEIKTLFRYCPSCGKRFQIRLVGKKMVSEREELSVEDTEHEAEVWDTAALMGGYGGDEIPVELEEKEPITVELERFRYTYKCKHCGHVWTEIHEKEKEREEA